MSAIYLDNAATSYPKPDGVVMAMEHYIKHIGASAGRGSYERAQKACEIVTETRENLE
ncbi:aminotransferase class V-fold PLP-dependent enzyme [Natranaerofaba carboxydovora]|uniref:aminotransferase class V-fold PLP-dependent enzyme n=1 Tax=Natranaerofaba carboxydovora TaxID=2742683 RepID=UPI001F12A6E1|nr:aminotransferase class V-fold PLP-dependent enzyme [Natranaerofaba carboxydovora]UMZ73171.1 Aminotransferase class-V [Natranaerofaba carboxydovora]